MKKSRLSGNDFDVKKNLFYSLYFEWFIIIQMRFSNDKFTGIFLLEYIIGIKNVFYWEIIALFLLMIYR